MGSPSRNVQYHPPRLSEDRLNLPQPHSPSLPTHCTAPGNRECARTCWIGVTGSGERCPIPTSRRLAGRSTPRWTRCARTMTCSPSRMACSLSRAAGRRFPRPVTSANLSEFVKALLARCGDSAPEAALPDRLPEVLENLRREELRRSAETATEETAGETAQKIEERIEECEARLKEIDRRYPELDDDVQAFDASQGKPHLQGILEALRGQASSWRAAAETRSSSLAMLVTELRRVRSEDAAKCAAELRGYLDPRRQTWDERNRLQAKRTALQVELRRAHLSERAGKLMGVRAPLQGVASGLRDVWLDLRETGKRQDSARKALSRLHSLAALEEALCRGPGLQRAGAELARDQSPCRHADRGTERTVRQH